MPNQCSGSANVLKCARSAADGRCPPCTGRPSASLQLCTTLHSRARAAGAEAHARLQPSYSGFNFTYPRGGWRQTGPTSRAGALCALLWGPHARVQRGHAPSVGCVCGRSGPKIKVAYWRSDHDSSFAYSPGYSALIQLCSKTHHLATVRYVTGVAHTGRIVGIGVGPVASRRT